MIRHRFRRARWGFAAFAVPRGAAGLGATRRSGRPPARSLAGVEGGAQPFDAVAVDGNDIEPARRRAREAAQKVARGEDQALALGGADARRSAAEALVAARPNLDEHER